MSLAEVQHIYTTGLYKHARVVQDDQDRIFFLTPERVGYEVREDTITHICSGFEDVMDLTVAYFKDLINNPLDMWEVVAAFQPYPIQDPHVPLKQGSELLIPSMDFVREVAFGPSLADAPEI